MLFKDLKAEDRFVAFLATILVLLFASIAVASMFFPVRSDAEIKQTVIALVMLAAGYYLGSSARKSAQPTPEIPTAPVSTTTTVTDDATVTKTEPAAPIAPLTPSPAAPAPQA